MGGAPLSAPLKVKPPKNDPPMTAYIAESYSTIKIGVLGMTSKKKTDYLMTLIKRVGGYLAEITTS